MSAVRFSRRFASRLPFGRRFKVICIVVHEEFHHPDMLENKIIKAAILIGGPAKGTRFRPLSLELPKPLFPVAGYPMVYHHIEAFSKVPNIKEILLIGFYQPNETLTRLISDAEKEFGINIR